VPRDGGNRSEEALWAEVRQQEIRFVLLTVIVIALSTAYVAFLNAYVIAQGEPSPYVLQIDKSEGFAETAVYAVRMQWDPVPVQEAAMRPVVTLQGRPVPNVGDAEASLQLAPRVEPSSPYAVVVRVPGGVTPGTHSGRLVLDRVGGDADLPPRLTTPVTVGVTGGLWTSWFLLRDWLLFVMFMVAVLYVFCLLVFPPPSGMLTVLRWDGGVPRKTRLFLRTPRLSWLAPWRRSTVSLRTVWRRAGCRSGPDGEMLFLFPALPVLLLRRRRGDPPISRRVGDVEDLETLLEDPAFTRCGAVDIMYEGHAYRMGEPSTPPVSLLKYSAKTSTHR
jgi:hypothetical protein